MTRICLSLYLISISPGKNNKILCRELILLGSLSIKDHRYTLSMLHYSHSKSLQTKIGLEDRLCMCCHFFVNRSLVCMISSQNRLCIYRSLVYMLCN